MESKAESLLKVYLEESTVLNTVEQKTMAEIKKSMNFIIMELVKTSTKVEKEAKRLFTEILERSNAENIDPIMRMKTEAALYKVIVKELSVYGNSELTKKAIDFIHEVSQHLPHESPTNDMIMGNRTKQIQY